MPSIVNAVLQVVWHGHNLNSNLFQMKRVNVESKLECRGDNERDAEACEILMKPHTRELIYLFIIFWLFIRFCA